MSLNDKNTRERNNKMFKPERIQRIKEYLLQHEQAYVQTLSAQLNVSDATIRNDFNDLEKEGFIVRFHGGAMLNDSGSPDQEIGRTLPSDDVGHDPNKEELGIIASHLIQEKEWVFLGPGTTSYYIARELARRSNIHILTNNLMAAGVLASNPSIQTIVIGGEIHTANVYTLPENIEKELDNIYLNKAFFSIDGADIKSGYTLSDTYILEIINTVCNKCEEFFLAIDYTKYGKRSFMKLADINFTHNVIINENTPAKYRQYYANHNIKTYTLSAIANQKDPQI